MAEAREAITDVVNWLQVRMSGEDIKTKIANNARNGDTIGRAPVGYLNVSGTASVYIRPSVGGARPGERS
jgi:hypothetical protein